MYITAHFSDSTGPRSDLTPYVEIYDLDTDVAVSTGTMSSVGTRGLYKYTFAAYNSGSSYGYVLDGGSGIADNLLRYRYGGNDDYGLESDVEELDSTASAIQAKTDNLKDSWNDPTAEACQADVSGLATTAHLTTVEGKVDTVDTVVDAIKLKTDNLKDSWNDLSAAQVYTQIETAIQVYCATSATVSALNAKADRILGLSQQNFIIDNTHFTGSNMDSCRIRLFELSGNVPALVDAGGSETTGLIATYLATASYEGVGTGEGNLEVFRQVEA